MKKLLFVILLLIIAVTSATSENELFTLYEDSPTGLGISISEPTTAGIFKYIVWKKYDGGSYAQIASTNTRSLTTTAGIDTTWYIKIQSQTTKYVNGRLINSVTPFDEAPERLIRITAAGAVALHDTTHEVTGSDEIDVTGLSGVLADAQTPAAHDTTHETGGSDEITTELLEPASGSLGDILTITAAGGPFANDWQSDIDISGSIDLGGLIDGVDLAAHVADTTTVHLASQNAGTIAKFLQSDGSVATWAAGSTIAGHNTTHETLGADEINVTDLAGLLADAQTPAAHNQSADTITDGTLDLATGSVHVGVFPNDIMIISPTGISANDSGVGPAPLVSGRRDGANVGPIFAAIHAGGVDGVYFQGNDGTNTLLESKQRNGGGHIALADASNILATIGKDTINAGTLDGVWSREGFENLLGTYINEFSTDTTLGGNSDLAIPTEKAVKTYIGNFAAPIGHVGAGGAAHADVIAGAADGFMTGTDKQKLDGIATGADVTGNNAPQAHTHNVPDLAGIATNSFVGRDTAGTGAGEVISATNARTILNVANGADVTGSNAPQAHKVSHQNGGSDEIGVAGLSGVLADAQTPAAHNQSASTITSGTLAIARGGTNQTSYTDQQFVMYDSGFGKLLSSGFTGSAFAPAAEGVTNGDSHDHAGGDGAAIESDAMLASYPDGTFTLVVDVRINFGSATADKKTRNFTISNGVITAISAESAWTDITI